MNSEHEDFRTIAETEGVYFHKRPKELGDNQTTNEKFIVEFLEKHQCNLLYQVHSIAPLLTVNDILSFVDHMEPSDYDCLLSTEEIQIECAFKNKPVNFSFASKTNSQELVPIQRVNWSISGWKKDTFLSAVNFGRCATYSGKVVFYPISRFAAHVIKTEADLEFAEAVLPLAEKS